MKLIVGLGNPGKEYERTRHNVGFRVLDRLAGKEEFKFEKKFESEIARVGKNLLVKPRTFMNDSGRAVKRIMDFYKLGLEDLVIVHDDLDIRLGSHKIQVGKGPKIHNGVNNVEQHLGENNFKRVRVGVDNRSKAEQKEPGSDYVLGKFKKVEEINLEVVIEQIVEGLLELL